MDNKNTFPTFDQYFAEREEAFYELHPELRDHPELDTLDGGVSAKIDRRMQAQFAYCMELAAYNERRAAAEKEAQTLKTEYESRLKDVYESKGLERSDTDKAFLKVLENMEKKAEQEEKSLTAFMQTLGGTQV